MSTRGPAAGRGPTRRTAGRSGSARAGQGSAGRAASGQERPGRQAPARGRAGDPDPQRRSGRALRAGAVAALAVVCLLSVLAPLTTYVREQSTTASLTRQVEEATRGRAALDAAVTRWDDPAFVSAQARERLHYVRPGETGYVVLDLPAEPSADAPAAAGPVPVAGADGPVAATDVGGRGPWYGRLWGSVEVAGQ